MGTSKRFLDSSQRLINCFGHIRTYKHITGQQYNVDTQMMETTETSVDIKTFKTEPKERELKYPNLVTQETAVILIAASDIAFIPKVNDKIIEQLGTETNTYTVTVVKENWSDSAVVSWRLVCSRG